jgi:hypothetical protein
MYEPDTGENPPQSAAAHATNPGEVEDAHDFLGENVQADRGEDAQDWPPPAGEEGVSNCADDSEADENAFADNDLVNDAAQDADDADPRALFKAPFEE